jgi:VCBS repeat-containing protein
MLAMIRHSAVPIAVALLLGSATAAEGASNHRPHGQPDRGTTGERTPIRIPVLRNDRDRDGDRLTVTGVRVQGTRGVVSVSRTGRTIVYDPTGAFDALATGETAIDRFSYTLSDGRGGHDRVVAAAVTVSGVSGLPTLYPYPLMVGANTGGNYFDIFGELEYPNITITAVTQPPHGHAYLNGGTTLGYDPPFGYCNSGGPTDDFTYTITNGTTTATGQVHTTVDCG